MLFPTLSAAEPWLMPGDIVLRHDLELLADAGVLHGPVTQWPIPWPDIARDVQAFAQVSDLTPGEQGALLRVQSAAHVARCVPGSLGST